MAFSDFVSVGAYMPVQQRQANKTVAFRYGWSVSTPSTAWECPSTGYYVERFGPFTVANWQDVKSISLHYTGVADDVGYAAVWDAADGGFIFSATDSQTFSSALRVSYRGSFTERTHGTPVGRGYDFSHKLNTGLRHNQIYIDVGLSNPIPPACKLFNGSATVSFYNFAQ